MVELIAARREAPDLHERDDVLSVLIRSGEEDEKWLRDQVMNMLAAGHETTTNLIGNAMLALLRNPDQLRRLREDPSLLRTGVEECLRYDSPVQFTARITTEELEVDGHRIPAGDQVIVVVGAANRDPAQFRDPERLDFGRPEKENRHLSFAAGPHYCLGASLARLEAQVAIGTLLRRLDNVELITTAPVYRKHFVLRGVEELRVGFSTSRKVG